MNYLNPENLRETKERFDIDRILRGMQAEVVKCNTDNGWYDKDRTLGEGIALIHSEVSEMLEAFRHGGNADQTYELCPQPHGHAQTEHHFCKPEGIGSEAADILIRLLDECARQDIDLGFEFRRKMDYNRTRGYRHGNKLL